MNFLADTIIGFNNLETILTPITNQFSVVNITSFITGIISMGVPFVFLWWGVRKLDRAILKVATKGKIGI
ncbi:MAG: hypothetical protein IKT33_01675 [Clostridia bacterium]|nr:hypothetical protein [Clostridia bacterium]